MAIDISSHRGALSGRHVMIVEDDFLIAWDLVDFFAEAGAEVIGPYSSLSAAMAQAGRAEAAVLDITLRNNQKVFPLADMLTRAGIPFVFYTGYGSEIPPRFAACGMLDKDFAAWSEEGRVQDEVTRMLPVLRLAARLQVEGNAAADDLVERTLRAAIARSGERPEGMSVAHWLCRLMAQPLAG